MYKGVVTNIGEHVIFDDGHNLIPRVFIGRKESIATKGIPKL